jgi:hypothetical protein
MKWSPNENEASFPLRPLQLNLVVKQAYFTVRAIKLFLTNLSGFSSFYSVSAKRADLLRNVCGCSVPKSVETRSNSHSRVVSNVYNNKDALFECFDLGGMIFQFENQQDFLVY